MLFCSQLDAAERCANQAAAEQHFSPCQEKKIGEAHDCGLDKKIVHESLLIFHNTPKLANWSP
jgi:hypothetical protein